MNSTIAIKSLRGKRLKTQQDIANKISISRQNYNIYESDVKRLDLNTIFKVLYSLEANEDELDEFFYAVKQDYLSYKEEKK